MHRVYNDGPATVAGRDVVQRDVSTTLYIADRLRGIRLSRNNLGLPYCVTAGVGLFRARGGSAAAVALEIGEQIDNLLRLERFQ